MDLIEIQEADASSFKQKIGIKRQQFSLQTKLNILSAVDSGRKKKQVAVEYGISHSTLSTILKDRLKIEQNAQRMNMGTCRKRMRSSAFRQVDDAVLMWFQEKNNRGIPINNRLIQITALKIAKLLGYEKFNASSGWLSRFRDRYGLPTASKDATAMEVESDEFEEYTGSKLCTFVEIELKEGRASSKKAINIVKQIAQCPESVKSDNELSDKKNETVKPVVCNSKVKKKKSEARGPKKINFSQAFSCFQLLEHYFSNTKDNDIYSSLKIIENSLTRITQKQNK